MRMSLARRGIDCDHLLVVKRGVYRYPVDDHTKVRPGRPAVSGFRDYDRRSAGRSSAVLANKHINGISIARRLPCHRRVAAEPRRSASDAASDGGVPRSTLVGPGLTAVGRAV